MSGQRDGVRGIAPVPLLEPLSHVAGGATASVDTRDGASLTVLAQVGDTVDGGATFKLQESDDDMAWNDIAEPLKDLMRSLLDE